MGNQITQDALLQGGSQTVGHFGDRLAGQRIVDQETVTANFLHHPLHFGRDATSPESGVSGSGLAWYHCMFIHYVLTSFHEAPQARWREMANQA